MGYLWGCTLGSRQMATSVSFFPALNWLPSMTMPFYHSISVSFIKTSAHIEPNMNPKSIPFPKPLIVHGKYVLAYKVTYWKNLRIRM